MLCAYMLWVIIYVVCIYVVVIIYAMCIFVVGEFLSHAIVGELLV